MTVSSVGQSQMAYPQVSETAQPRQKASSEEASESAAERTAEASSGSDKETQSSGVNRLDIMA